MKNKGNIISQEMYDYLKNLDHSIVMTFSIQIDPELTIEELLIKRGVVQKEPKVDETDCQSR